MSLVTANNLINTWNLNGGSLDADFVDTIQGLIVDIDFVYSLPNITGLGNEAIILEDTSLGAIPLNLLSGITSGAIDASSISTLTGAAEDLNTAYDSNGITGLNNENVTLSDTTLDAAVLNTLDGNTSGAIDAKTVTTLTGAAEDLNTAYASNGITNWMTRTSPSLTPLSTLPFSTPSMATPQAPLMPAPSTPSPGLLMT